VTSFPQHGSLAGLSKRELDAIIPTLERREVVRPPGPLKYGGIKLSNDADHPFMEPGPDDMRGPCPGLNTLANHGFLPRNGIASPTQIINAVQEGFNMGNDLAIFNTFLALLVNGNPVTNLLSIGGKSPLTGMDPPPPSMALVAGLDNHGTFEGDTSMTRGDAFFGNNFLFNETLFEQFLSFSDQFGGGNYTLDVATELRFQRTQQSTMTNPNFTFTSRQFSAYAEAVLPSILFVDGRNPVGTGLNKDDARSIFENMHMPDDFHRAAEPLILARLMPQMATIYNAHPVLPGANQGGVNNYVVDPNAPILSDICGIYTSIANVTVPSLYPDPTGIVRRSLKGNLDNLFIAFEELGCTQVFPYGQ